ncbi:Uncharacterised protein [Dorea longicatena]|nr:Uncharacterised protein [Dorea longicatena]
MVATAASPIALAGILDTNAASFPNCAKEAATLASAPP